MLLFWQISVYKSDFQLVGRDPLWVKNSFQGLCMDKKHLKKKNVIFDYYVEVSIWSQSVAAGFQFTCVWMQSQ